MTSTYKSRFPLIVLFLAFSAGCGGSETAAAKGQALFADPTFSHVVANAFSCATCHATIAQPGAEAGAAPTGHTMAGYTLFDARARPSWWGGGETTLLDAVDECYSSFMGAPPLATDDAEGRALLVYLESISPDASAPALPLTEVKNIVDVPNGDATRGAATYAQACANCHGSLHSGSGRIGASTIIPDDSIAAHGTDPKKGARGFTIEKVRHGRFFEIGGTMPLFSVEALSDGQLGDILAYVGL